MRQTLLHALRPRMPNAAPVHDGGAMQEDEDFHGLPPLLLMLQARLQHCPPSILLQQHIMSPTRGVLLLNV
jgi:hypothetical protein